MLQYVKHKQRRYGAMERRPFIKRESPKSQVNNGSLIYLMTAVLLMATFVSCKKDRSSSDDGNKVVIDATVVNGDDCDGRITTVKARMYDYDAKKEYIIASAKYENNKFKLTLPGTIPDKCLYGIIDGMDDFEGTLSDREAKISKIYLLAYLDDNLIGVFRCKNDANDDHAWYVYVDRNVTINGRHSADYYDGLEYNEIDCSFTKGWNILYSEGAGAGGKSYLTTTRKPSGANYEWYGYFWLKKNSPGDKGTSYHPFSEMWQVASNPL